ncbi:MAG: hypothetical protein E7439_06835 [Ruminococcaceae bacterium]|nr:hypothetical protein [Oscillospiraceae bacterium]
MKKLFVFVFVLVLALGTLGCEEQNDTTFTIDDAVTKVDVTYFSGNSTSWSIEGADIDALRNWLSGLKCKPVEFEKGKSPGDMDGGTVYGFECNAGELTSFYYIITGPNDYYLLIKSTWYYVINPSDPPVTPPET